MSTLIGRSFAIALLGALALLLAAAAPASAEPPECFEDFTSEIRLGKPAEFRYSCFDPDDLSTVTNGGPVVPDNGTATVGTDPNTDEIVVTFTPDAIGPAGFSLTVTDDQAETTVIQQAFDVVANTPPDCFASLRHLKVDEPTTFFDPCFDDDFNQDDVLTYTVTQQPQTPAGDPAGTVTVTDEDLTYTPPAGFEGIAAFDYTASDGTEATPVTQRLHVSDGIVCEADAPLVVRSGDTAFPDDNCTKPFDLDGTIETVVETQPTKGVLDEQGPSTFSRSYRAFVGLRGADSYTFHGRLEDDPTVRSDTVEQELTLVGRDANHAPECFDEDTTITVGQAERISAFCTDADVDRVRVRIVTPPAGPARASVEGDEAIRFSSSATGVFTLTAIARDRAGADSEPFTMTVTVEDEELPECSAVSPQPTQRPGESRFVSVFCSNADAYLITAEPANGEVARSASSEPGSGAFYYTADEDAPDGPDTFTFEASNTLGKAPPVTVTMNIGDVANLAPDCFLPSGSYQVQTSRTTDVDLGFHCFDGSPGDLAYAVTAATGGTVADGPEPDRVAYSADATAGAGTVTFTVTDTAGASDSFVLPLTKGTAAAASPVCETPDLVGLKGGSSIATTTECDDPNSGWHDSQRIAVVGSPGKGSVDPATATHGSFSLRTYTADTDATGTDTYTLRSDTATGRSAAVTQTVTFANRAPSCFSFESIDAPRNVATRIPATVCTDPDGDPVTLEVVTPPVTGTVVQDGAGLEYTSTGDHLGPDDFAFRATDGRAFSDAETMSVDVYPRAGPDCLVETPAPLVRPGATLTLPLECYDETDFEFELQHSVTTPPGGGSSVVIDRDNDELRFTAGPTAGAASFAYRATSSNGPGDPVTQPVEITPDANAVPNCLETRRVTPLTATAEPISAEGVGCEDADSDAMTLTALTNPAHGTFADGTYTSEAGYTGADSFMAVVDDGHGASVVTTVQIVVQAAAKLTCIPDDDPGTIRPGGVAFLTVDCSDTLGAELFSLSAPRPAHGTVERDGFFRIVYTADPGTFEGTDTIAVTATSESGATDTYTQKVIVDPDFNRRPHCSDGGVKTRPGQAVTLAPSCSDADGDPLTLEQLTDPEPAAGTVTGGGTQPFVFTPASSYTGPAEFTFRAADDRGATSDVAYATVAVTGQNTPPDCAGGSVEVVTGGSVSVDAVCTDEDGDTVTVAVLGAPEHGDVTLNAGRFTYTPDGGYTGPDSFSYRGSDGKASSSPATVSIQVLSTPPAPTCAPVTETTKHGTAKAITLDCEPRTGGPLTYSIVTQPAAGTGTLSAVDGDKVTYAPPSATFTGAATFTYRATEGGRQADPATVTINVTNAAPSCTLPAAQTATVGLVKTIAVTCTDADGDALTLDATATSGATVTTPNATTLRFTGAAAGASQVTFTAGDGIADSAPRTFTVTVAEPVKPVCNPATANVQHGKTVTVAVECVPTPGLTYAISTPPGDGTAAGGGAVTYTAPAGFTGEATFAYTATDARGTSDPQTVTVTVGNETPPTCTAPGAQTTARGTPVTVTVTCTDGDGDPLTVSGTAANGTVAGGTAGTLTYTPAAGFTGPDTVTFKASDGVADAPDQTFPVTVNAPTTNPPGPTPPGPTPPGPTPTPPTPPGPTPLDPDDPFAVKVKTNKKGGAKLTLTAPLAGRFAAVAKAGRKRIASGRVAAAAGQVQLKLKPSKKGLKAIRRKGRLKVTITMTLTTATGPVTDTVKATLKAKKKKKKRRG